MIGTNFLFNTAYMARITPYNDCGLARNRSPVVSFTTDKVVPQVAPTGFTNTVNDGVSVNFTWEAIPSTNAATGGDTITAYQFQRYNVNLTDWWFTTVQQTLAFSVGWDQAVDNTVYLFKVAAVNSVGVGVYTADYQLTTPMKPVIMTPLSVSAETCTKVTIAWTTPIPVNAGRLPIINYNVQYKVTSKAASFFTVISTAPYTSLTYDIEYATYAMTWNTLYDVQVQS